MTCVRRKILVALAALAILATGCGALEAVGNLVAFPIQAVNLSSRAIVGCRSKPFVMVVTYAALPTGAVPYVDGRAIHVEKDEFNRSVSRCTYHYRPGAGDRLIAENASSERCDSREARTEWLKDNGGGSLVLPPIELRWPDGRRKEIVPRIPFTGCLYSPYGLYLYASCTFTGEHDTVLDAEAVPAEVLRLLCS